MMYTLNVFENDSSYIEFLFDSLLYADAKINDEFFRITFTKRKLL